MTATEIITVIVSTSALIVSILAIALQYSGRDDLKVKVADVSFVSLDAKNGEPRTGAIALKFVAYNMGNRNVAIENIALKLVNENYEELEKSKGLVCGFDQDTYIPPISKQTYGQLTIPPQVVTKESIYVEELVFDLFFFEKDKSKVHTEGMLCVNAVFSNSKAESINFSKPVGIVSMSLDRDKDNFEIKFNTDMFKESSSPINIF
ncbi:hypothetical protein [Pseudoalteromonas maricaloris]|uniref:hypothetical protein n=1 Tax=Pseudoalteromonas maricaloris TaxID=184924 RepID=UPI003C2060BB